MKTLYKQTELVMSTKEQQIVAIAKACSVINPRLALDYYGEHVLVADIGAGTGLVPDYFNDLNAMHEAEKVLTISQQGVYTRHLMDICGTSGAWHNGATTTLNWFWHATAAQRAEAFLRTLDLWKDTE